ncbi:Glutamyl-tRNA(Gln) synthetase [hydrothermal vent metagenome]|uniref:Glutamyl-tRNA(Gln) synthetase n=1 Tax=hydrothermal vent metagenome TaxID=652676 RepID=A0A1W1BFR9_9ZZZZ
MLRFAQSPTGDMHIDDLHIAILNYLVAQQRDERFAVRIDDTEKTSVIEGKDTEIMQILEKFALKHTSVFHQSEHLNIHQTLAIRLLEENKAFICTCTEEHKSCYKNCEDFNTSQYTRLKESKTPFVIRLKKPLQDIIIHNLIQETRKIIPDEMDSFIILHVDSTPTKCFASACDDMLLGITMVITKEKDINSAAKTEHIKRQLGYSEETCYVHLPAITDTPTLKMLFEEGYLPDAIINYLILLTSANTPQEIFTLPEAITWFHLENIFKSSYKFDKEKLRSINREHLRRMDDKQLSTLFGFADADIGKLAKLYLEKVSTISELNVKIKTIFSPKNFQGAYKEQMRTLETLIQNAPMFQDYSTFETYLFKESELKKEVFLKVLKLLLTGEEDAPELSEIYPLIKPYLLEIAS